MRNLIVVIVCSALSFSYSHGFFKDPREEIIIISINGNTYPTKLGELSFRKSDRGGPMVAYEAGTRSLKGIIADEYSLKIVYKYLENPDYHLDNAKKLGFYIGGPLVLLGFNYCRKRAAKKAQTKHIDPEKTDDEELPKNKLFSDREHDEAVSKMREALNL